MAVNVVGALHCSDFKDLQGVSKGVHAAIAKADEVEEKHHVTSKVASGVAFGFSKAAEGFDKLTEAASSRRGSRLTDSAPTPGQGDNFCGGHSLHGIN
eukprot:g25728.t1